MEQKRLYIKLENIIFKHLFVSYNDNCPKVSHKIFEKFFKQSPKIYLENLEFKNSENFQNLTVTKWRLPKTRIYLNTFISEKVEIVQLNSNNFNLFFIKNQFDNKDIEIELSRETTLFSMEEEKDEKLNSIHIKKLSVVGYLSYNGKIVLSGELVRFIEELINGEYAVCPVNIFQTHDVTFLQNLDQYWAALPLDHDKKTVNKTFPDQQLNQILADSLNTIIANDLEFSFDKKPIKGANFYNAYLLPEKNSDSAVKKNLQDFWNSVSPPFKKNYLTDLIYHSPYEIIAFLLLLYRHNFYWASTAFRKILEIFEKIDPPYIAMLRLCFLIKNKVTIEHVNENIIVNVHWQNEFKYSLKNEQITLKAIASAGNYLLTCRLYDRQIVIDKPVRIIYDKIVKSFKILPHTFQFECPIEWLEIKINDFYCLMPLCWKKFVLNANGVRFKFLFKGNRFQISLRAVKWVKEVFLNQQKIVFKDSIYQKAYLEKEKKEAISIIHFFDEDGRSVDISQLMPVNSAINVQSVIQDRYGFIADEIQMKKSTGKITFRQALAFPPQSINVDKPFDIWIKNSVPNKFVPDLRKSLLHDFKNTEASLLRFQACIFLSDKEKITEISHLLKSQTGLNITILPLEIINQTNFRFNILLAEENALKATVVNRQEYYNELIVEKAGKRVMIQIEPGNFPDFCEKYF